MSNDLISREALMQGRVENDPVRIAAVNAETVYDADAVILEMINECILTKECEEPFIMLNRAVEIVRNGGKK